jgi:hypothetical protein
LTVTTNNNSLGVTEYSCSAYKKINSSIKEPTIQIKKAL